MPKSKNKRKSKNRTKKVNKEKVNNYFKRFVKSFDVNLNNKTISSSDNINTWLDKLCNKMFKDHNGDEKEIIKARNEFVRFISKKMEEAEALLKEAKEKDESDS